MTVVEPMRLLRRRTIAPLHTRVASRLTYEVHVGDVSGDVYFNVTDKPFGMNVSCEPIALSMVRTVLAAPLATGEPFRTDLLRGVVGRAKHNDAALGAILRHEGLLASAPDRPHLHVCAGDWQDWVYAQRERLVKLAPPQPPSLDDQALHETGSG